MNTIKRWGAMVFCFVFAIIALYGALYAEGANVKQGIIYSSVFGLIMWMKWTEHEVKKEKIEEVKEQ